MGGASGLMNQKHPYAPLSKSDLKGEGRECMVINEDLPSGSVTGTLGGQQPGASGGANGF